MYSSNMFYVDVYIYRNNSATFVSVGKIIKT